MTKKKCAIMYGSLRSGTTVFRLMMDGHPAFNCPGEADYLFDFVSVAENAKLEFDYDRLANNRIFKASGLAINRKDNPADVVHDMINQLSRDDGSTLIIVLHRGIEKARRFLPDVPIIHLLRDPRDVARSSIGMGWAGNVYYGVDHWLETEAAWGVVARGVPQELTLEVKYETLIARPKEQLIEVCNFLGEDFHGNMLQYDQTSTYGAPDPNLVQQWKTKLSPGEIGLIEGRVGHLLSAAEYEPSGHLIKKPTTTERLRLWISNKIGVWRFRTKRFGVLDPVLDAVARNTGLNAIARAARRRMTATTIKHLK